ncbi:Aldo-keto reductase yakc [NADP(+)] [Cladophialophora carrionii]|uniref:Aldo-keto reductase yakc [NADP(+)] n=1 Tax=Cladophialophora carrionii TaxID=86049 RepID=A0A1C1CS84_9EURO|nr:Aldo-keto reductase yakc [NADP(+)] [Cladophialophora carrionii]
MASKIPRRRIGDSLVSAIGLGCMGMSIPVSTGKNDEECLRVLTRAADLGINFWVTSDSYGPEVNEELIGRWFKESGRRDEIFLCTKFGPRIVDGKPQVSGKPEYVKQACEASLRRLHTDHIDLYSQHRVDTQTPIEITVKAMAQLKNEGKIRHLGLSECSARTLRRASAVHEIAAAEMEFSPFALEMESPETDFLDTARALGVKIVAYSPLGRGFLTGAIKSRADFDPMDPRIMFPRFAEENFSGNLKLVGIFEDMAREKGCTPGQVALAWVLSQGDDFIPIPSTKHVKYLEENAGAVNVDFSRGDDERIRKAIDAIGGAKGSRYPGAFAAMCFADSPELEHE